MEKPAKLETYAQLGEILWPYSHIALDQIPFHRSWRCLDLGCGIGHVSTQLVLSHYCHFTGIDQDPAIIELAKQYTKQRGAQNTHFLTAAIESIDNFSKYNFIYGRLIFNRVNSPEAFIARILNEASPGTWILIEDMDCASYRIEPPCAALEKLMQIYEQYEKQKGRDPRLGAKLETLFNRNDLEKTYAASVLPTFRGRQPGKTLMAGLFKTLLPELCQVSMESEQKLTEWVDSFAAVSQKANSITSLNKIYQVIGKKL